MRTVVTRLLPALVSLALCGPAPAAVPDSERQALVDLYTSTGGPGWTNKPSWLGAAGTECSWFGITCDATGAHVRDIDLPSNNL